MTNNRTVPTIGAIAAVLFLTASGVRASNVGTPMDIKPGSCPNSYKIDGPSRGVIPVAILGTESLDVFDVDFSTLEIFRADGVGGRVSPLQGPPGPGPKVKDAATPFDGDPCDCHDLRGDGLDDLLVKFSKTELTNALELASCDDGEVVDLCVIGSLLDGTTILLGDCIRIVNPGQ